MVKRCEYCCRYFSPDKRVGNRQRACSRPECKRQRKLQAQKQWKQNHPAEVAKHYEDYVKPWRESRRAERQSHHNSEVIRDKTPLQDCLELVLRIPAEKKDMIRDEIRLLRVDSTTFAAYGP
ncbi:MAG: hypothetical protein ABSB95_16275 [Dissulfurispiraceae bacterium]